MKKILFISGPAGSGKTTISKQLAGILGVEFISSGDIVRSLVDAHKDLANGDLYYNDDLIMGAIDERIAKSNVQLIVVDGVPRTSGQIEWIKGNMGRHIYRILYIDAPTVKRIKRLIRRNRDEYDSHDVVLKRVIKDEDNMKEIYNSSKRILGIDKVMMMESAIDGDTSSEVDKIITLFSGMEV